MRNTWRSRRGIYSASLGPFYCVRVYRAQYFGVTVDAESVRQIAVIHAVEESASMRDSSFLFRDCNGGQETLREGALALLRVLTDGRVRYILVIVRGKFSSRDVPSVEYKFAFFRKFVVGV